LVEAERIAAEAAAKAEAERIAAETELIRLANTYSASGSVAVTGSVIITAVGTVIFIKRRDWGRRWRS
jgi:hypothetical protein